MRRNPALFVTILALVVIASIGLLVIAFMS